MKKYVFYSFLSATLILFSCNEDEYFSTNRKLSTCSFYISSPSNLQFTELGGTKTFELHSEKCRWSVQALPDWITITPDSGNSSKGSEELRIYVAPNQSVYSRKWSIRFGAMGHKFLKYDNISVEQDGVEPYVKVKGQSTIVTTRRKQILEIPIETNVPHIDYISVYDKETYLGTCTWAHASYNKGSQSISIEIQQNDDTCFSEPRICSIRPQFSIENVSYGSEVATIKQYPHDLYIEERSDIKYTLGKVYNQYEIPLGSKTKIKIISDLPWSTKWARGNKWFDYTPKSGDAGVTEMEISVTETKTLFGSITFFTENGDQFDLLIH